MDIGGYLDYPLRIGATKVLPLNGATTSLVTPCIQGLSISLLKMSFILTEVYKMLTFYSPWETKEPQVHVSFINY